MYPQTLFEPEYGAFNMKNKFSAHGLGLVVQMSWRVAAPYYNGTGLGSIEDLLT